MASVATAVASGSPASHQLPRLLGRKVHPHDLGVEGASQEVGGLLRGVGKARRDPEQRCPGGPQQATDDEPADRPPNGLDTRSEIDFDGEPPGPDQDCGLERRTDSLKRPVRLSSRQASSQV